jgi:hypothetical protein
MYQEKQFRVSLGVDRNSPPKTNVASRVEFCVLMELERSHTSMTLELNAVVTYLSSSRGNPKKTVDGR